MGQGKGQTTTTEQNQNWGPTAEVMGRYQDFLNRAQTASETPYVGYTGERIAAFTPDQQAAFEATRGGQGEWRPYYNVATGLAAAGARPAYETVGSYMNPYLDSVLGSTRANLEEVFGSQRNALTGNLISQHALGGDRAKLAEAELGRQQGLAAGKTFADLASSGWGQALTAAQGDAWRAANVGTQFANLGQGASGLAGQDAQRLLGIGGMQQQLNQAQMNVPYEQFLEARSYPFQTAQWYGNMLRGIAPQMGGWQSGTGSQTTPGPNPWAQGVGAAISLAGMFLNRGGRVEPRGIAGYAAGGAPTGGGGGESGLPYGGGGINLGIPLQPIAASEMQRPTMDLRPQAVPKPADNGVGDLFKQGIGLAGALKDKLGIGEANSWQSPEVFAGLDMRPGDQSEKNWMDAQADVPAVAPITPITGVGYSSGGGVSGLPHREFGGGVNALGASGPGWPAQPVNGLGGAPPPPAPAPAPPVTPSPAPAPELPVSTMAPPDFGAPAGVPTGSPILLAPDATGTPPAAATPPPTISPTSTVLNGGPVGTGGIGSPGWAAAPGGIAGAGNVPMQWGMPWAANLWGGAGGYGQEPGLGGLGGFGSGFGIGGFGGFGTGFGFARGGEVGSYADGGAPEDDFGARWGDLEAGTGGEPWGSRDEAVAGIADLVSGRASDDWRRGVDADRGLGLGAGAPIALPMAGPGTGGIMPSRSPIAGPERPAGGGYTDEAIPPLFRNLDASGASPGPAMAYDAAPAPGGGLRRPDAVPYPRPRPADIPQPAFGADPSELNPTGAPLSTPERKGGILGLGLIPENLRMPMVAAGIGMLASKEPNFGTALGEGLKAGYGTYQGDRKIEREQAELKRKAQVEERRLGFEEQRVGHEGKRVQIALDQLADARRKAEDDLGLRRRAEERQQGEATERARHNKAMEGRERYQKVGVDKDGHPIMMDQNSGKVFTDTSTKINVEKPVKPMPENARKAVGDAGKSFDDFDRLYGTFKKGYGGYMFGAGKVFNWAGRELPNVPPELKEQALWWQDYQDQKNLIRNTLFGSALTATEKAEFDKANISEGMQPDIIERNLERQWKAARSAAKKIAEFQIKAGQSPDLVEAALGVSLDRIGVTATKEAKEVPPRPAGVPDDAGWSESSEQWFTLTPDRKSVTGRWKRSGERVP